MTPKSFLSFINSYRDVYHRKEEEIGDLASRMNSGLSKLQEASRSVELLKEELNVMEQHLREANRKAEEVSVILLMHRIFNKDFLACRCC